MGRKKIVIVDDTELMLRIEESFLNREDLEVHTANSGMTALRKVVEVVPDLILLDLNMPDLDGDQVCAQIKAAESLRNAQIVIVTAEENDPVFKRCIAAGCDGFIIKPFSKERFLSKVRDHLAIADRKFARVPVEIPCTCTIGGNRTAGVAFNLSEGGAYIRAASFPGVGSSIEIRMALPEDAGEVSCRSVVRWEKSIGDGVGFGVEFLDLPHEQRHAITGFVEAAPARRTGPCAPEILP